MDREKVIKGLEAHATGSGCMKNCPYWGKETLNCSRELATDALALLKAQEPSKREIKHAISNVDIPKDIDEEQFFAVLAQQYAALARLYGEDVTIYSPS